MRKVLSMMLAIVMIITALPASVFATEDVIAEDVVTEEPAAEEPEVATEVSEEVNEIPENYGTEVALGSGLYYIEDGDLLYSLNNGRPKTINDNVTWVIEDNGDVYYSKLDGNNTYIYKVGEETEVVKLFCPADCFDVYEDDVYYSYNGEITKINVVSGEELFVVADNNLCYFYLNENGIIKEIETVEKNEKESVSDDVDTEEAEESEEIELNASISIGKYYSLTNFSGRAIIPIYSSVGGQISKVLNFYNYSKIHISVSHKTLYSGEYWFTTNIGDGTSYIRATDLLKYFKHGEKSDYMDMEYFLPGGYSSSPEMYKGVSFSAPCKSSHSYHSQRNSSGKVIDTGVCRNCGYKFNYKVTLVNEGGVYTRKSDSNVQTTMKTEPYSDADNVEDGSGDIKEYRIDGYIENAYGNKWYLVSERKIFFNKKLTGWVNHEKIDKYFNAPTRIETTTPQWQNGNFSGVQSNITISPWNYPTGTINKAKFNLTGSISSNNNLISATALVINANTGAIALEAHEYIGGGKNYLDIGGSNLNYGLKFANLAAGTYYLQYSATDTSYIESTPWRSSNFNVVDPYAPNCPEPSVNVSAIEYGQRVSASCNEPNALIHLKIDGKETSGYNAAWTDITTAGNHTITSWTTNGAASSGTVTKTVSVEQKQTPVISDAKYTDSGVKVTISGNGEIYYTTNGKTPSKSSTRYTGPIELKDSKKITAINTGYGCVNSAVASKTITVKEPDAPQIKVEGENKVAQGKSVKVSWKKADRAVKYTAYLMKNGTEVKKYTTENTYVTFILDEKNETENIEYTIKVVASNFKGDSEDSNIVDVTAMHPVTVTFIDRILRENGITDDVISQIQQNVDEHNAEIGEEIKQIEGNTISVQRIDYNSKPSIPLWEDRTGFSRQYFSDEAYQKITEDTTAYAYYSVKSYDVEFWNYWRDYSENNVQIGITQSILYSFSAEPPTAVEAPTGYVLAGWSVDTKVSECYDFTFVEGNMKLNTVYTWENMDLPVELKILSAKRGNTCESYTVNLEYSPYNASDIQGRIIVTLYTSDNKVVDVSVKDVDLMALDPGFIVTDSITVGYPDQVSRISAVMVGVEEDLTGGAISEMVSTTDIEMPTADTYWGRWSEWSTTEPDSAPAYNENNAQGVERVIEQKTQYRYRNYEYTESNASTLDGWELYDKQRTSWGKRKGPVEKDPSNGVRLVESERYVKSSNYKKVYRYYRIANDQHALWGSAAWDYLYRYNYEFDTPLDIKPKTSYSFYLPCDCYTLTSRNDWFHTVYSVNYLGEPYPAEVKVSDNYATRWYYYNPVYTYYYKRYKEWSEWSDNFVKGDDNETRTVYRYRDEFNCYEGYDPSNDSQLQEETVKTYEMSGNIKGLERDYNGKTATVLVYKKTNNDPTQEQLEYVEQITLGENNSYSFVINPKDEIDYLKTGDYIVTLSIEGCEKLANIDIIKAPRPEHTVNFYNEGELYASVSVEDGEGIDVNQIGIPEKEGMRFVKWNKPVVNITKNLDIEAVYEPELITVIFVDYENETLQIEEIAHGDYMISTPKVEPVSGKTFSHWKKVTSDVTAAPPMTGSGGGIIIGSQGGSTGMGPTIVAPGGGMTGVSADIVREYRIYEAVWTPNIYRVQFVDLEGNVISFCDVEYGEAAELPDMYEKDGVLYSWDVTGSEWWNVTSDMTIYPYIPQSKNISAPTINASTEDGGGMFYTELEANAEDETVYYSMEEISEERAKEFVREITKVNSGETESINLMAEEEIQDDKIKKYTEPIQIDSGTIVYAFAVDSESNISPIAVFEFGGGIDSSDAASYIIDENSNSPIIYLPKLSVKEGETVQIPLNIKNNPSITSLSVIIGYDKNSFADVNVKNGEVFTEEEFVCDIRDDGTLKITWQSYNENTNDGVLALLEFTAADKILDGKITAAIEETSVPSYGENPFIVADGMIKVDDTLIGDVNDDGEVDFADGIRILKHDVGLIDLVGDDLVTGDVNGDGEVDFADAILVLKFDVGLISSFKK